MNQVVAAVTLVLGLKKPQEQPKERPGTPRPSITMLEIPIDSRPLSPVPTKGKIDRSFSFSMDRTFMDDEKRISYTTDYIEDEE